MLVRHLEFGEAFSDQGQVALGSRGAGVSYSKYAAKAPRCVIEEPLGKDEFVSRGSGALHDRNHVCVSQPEACVIVGAERASRQGEQSARERFRLGGAVCTVECNRKI